MTRSKKTARTDKTAMAPRIPLRSGKKRAEPPAEPEVQAEPEQEVQQQPAEGPINPEPHREPPPHLYSRFDLEKLHPGFRAKIARKMVIILVFKNIFI